MVKVDRDLEASLVHVYDPTKYDPVKAHEYYLKNRQLKGRNLGRAASTDQKESWAFAKDQIGKDQKQASTAAADANKAAVAKLQATAQARHKEIAQQIKDLMARISNEAQTANTEADQKAKAAIAALPPAPTGLTKQARAEFNAKRADEIAKIRGEQTGKKKDVSSFGKAWRAGAQKDATDQRTQVATELKTSLDKAKQAYQTARDQLKEKFNSELDTAFATIQNQGGG